MNNQPASQPASSQTASSQTAPIVGYGRRQFLRTAAAAGLLSPALLAACGGSSTPDAASGTEETTGDAVASSGDAGTVRVASWPFYIENDQDPASSPTIKTLVAAGTAVDYQASIDDNIAFQEKFAADLKGGTDFGYDVCIPTSWVCANWIKENWVQPIPADLVPNKANIVDSLANPAWDEGRKFTLPYAIGQTGIAYYPDKVGFEITSLADFLRPELAGKTTILSELRDTVGTFLLHMGKDPSAATTEEMLAAIAEIKKYRDQGHFKKITGNGYAEDLALGDTWAALAWSGDVAGIQADKPDLKWVLPAGGAMSFVDTMVIPKGGNAAAAAKWMNHIYDPKVAAGLYEAIGYVSPVKGAADLMSAEAKASPFINPAASTKLYDFKPFTGDEAATVEEAFAAATQQ